MENNSESMEQEVKSGKSTSYFKFILVFSIAMAALLVGLNYLFNHLF